MPTPESCSDEFNRDLLEDRNRWKAEATRLREWLQSIINVHDLSPELFRSDKELADNLRDRAELALGGAKHQPEEKAPGYE